MTSLGGEHRVSSLSPSSALLVAHNRPLPQVLGVTSENFANLTPLILVCTAFNSIPFFVTLTMDGSDNSDLTQGSEDGQHELCQSNGEGLLLVEHAHI